MEKSCWNCSWCVNGKCNHPDLTPSENVFDEFIYQLFEDGLIYESLDEVKGLSEDKKIEICDSIFLCIKNNLSDCKQMIQLNENVVREFHCYRWN